MFYGVLSATVGAAYVQQLKDTKRDFTASVYIKGSYTQPFDQASLFIHIDGEECSRWAKAGPEHEGSNFLGFVPSYRNLHKLISGIRSVVTMQFSDWGTC